MIRPYAAARAALLRTSLASMALVAGSPAPAQTVREHAPARFEIVCPAFGERIKERAQHSMRHMPEPVSTPWWKY